MWSAAVAGEFRPCLLQVRLDATRVVAGNRNLAMTYWWQNAGDAPADGEERVFVHIRREGEAEDAPDGVRLGADHSPAVPTQRWRPGRVVTYTAPIRLNDQMPPGKYVVLVGMFDPDGGGRREIVGPPLGPDKDRRYLVARFAIVPAEAEADPTPQTATFAPVPPPEAQPAPEPPQETVTVGDGSLAVVLDRQAPRIVAWKMGTAELGGDPELWQPEVRVLSLKENRVRLIDRIAWSAQPAKDGFAYRGTIRAGDNDGVEFTLVFALKGNEATITLAKVAEQGDCRLVSVRFGRLVSAGKEGAMALPLQAGRLVTPGAWAPAECVFGMDWGSQMLAGVVYNQQLLCAVDLPSIDNRMVAAADPQWVALGASLECCVPAKPGIPPLQLGDTATIRLRFAAPAGRAPTWMDGAALLRQDVTAQPPAIYDNTVIYKIFCDSPGAKGFTTFDQALDLIRRYRNLIDGAPQIAYLVGWQHTGHDTGYPDVFTVNARLGGREKLLAAMADTKQYNAVLSFHDNYDDAYQNSPAWNPDLIARDPAGNPMKGGVWAGGQSYIVSFSAAATPAAVERVRRTLAFLPIETSYHIDVLSAVPRRLDLSATHPASGMASLAGKEAIIHAFNEAGVDVTSEGMCAPFVGVIGHAWHLQRRDQAYFASEARIPFVPFVYHGHATYGGARPTDEDIPDALLYGTTFSADFSRSTPAAVLTDSYYLLNVPFLLLRRREITNYHAESALRRVEYGPATYVEVGEGHYRVVLDGRVVTKDFSTFAPNWRGDAWLAYSRKAGTVEYDAPDGWTDPTRIHAVALTAEGPGDPVPVTLVGDRIRIELAASQPCRMTYGEPR